MKIILETNKKITNKKKLKKIAIVKNNIAIRIAGKVSRYIDASMNRATPRYLCAVGGDFCFPRLVTGVCTVYCRWGILFSQTGNRSVYCVL